MTEEEWLGDADILEALDWVTRTGTDERVRVLKRKLRLFVAACLARVDLSEEADDLRAAFEVLERLADDEVIPGIAEVAQVRIDAIDASMRRASPRSGRMPTVRQAERGLRRVVWQFIAQRSFGEIQLWVHHLIDALRWLGEAPSHEPSLGGRSDQLPTESLRISSEELYWRSLMHQVFGNPFRPVPFSPSWRTANSIALARTIYDERCFDRLPILADALMDAGCDSEAILAHCRNSGPHVRGCWVVDLVLGKG